MHRKRFDGAPVQEHFRILTGKTGLDPVRLHQGDTQGGSDFLVLVARPNPLETGVLGRVLGGRCLHLPQPVPARSQMQDSTRG